MVCRGICIRHKASKPNDSGRYALDRNVVKYVRYLSNGMDCGVHAVDID